MADSTFHGGAAAATPGGAATLAMEGGGVPGTRRDGRPDPRPTDLVARARAGDTEAFEELLRRHERPVYRLARSLLGRAEDAEDAAQEAFLRLYRSLRRLDPARPVAPYLYRLTVNVCRDLERRGRRHRDAVALDELTPALEPADRRPDPSASAGLAEQRRIAAAALRTLPPRQRAALVLRDVHGLSTREVAEVLRSREVTVRTQICRARLKLRRFRDRSMEEEDA